MPFRGLLLALLVWVPLAACAGGDPGAPPPPPAGEAVRGEIVRVEGRAEVGREGAYRAAAEGDSVDVGDVVRTGEGEVDVRLGDSLAIRVKRHSAIVLVRNDLTSGEVGPRTLHAAEIRLDAGTVLQRIDRAPRTTDYRIRHVAAGAVVRGTWFAAAGDAEALKVSVVDGEVTLENEAGARRVGARQAAEAGAGAAPTAARALLDREFNELQAEIGSLRFYLKAMEFTEATVDVAQMANIETTLEVWAAQHGGRYPSTLAEADWHAPDPYGTPYDYRVSPDGRSWTLTSAGPDRRLGTEDDVRYK